MPKDKEIEIHSLDVDEVKANMHEQGYSNEAEKIVTDQLEHVEPGKDHLEYNYRRAEKTAKVQGRRRESEAVQAIGDEP